MSSDPAVSPANTGRFFFASDGVFKYSENGGAYATAFGGGGNTLNAAYDQGGAGLGREIDVDSGAVAFKINSAAAT
jgi:hypothetical protein